MKKISKESIEKMKEMYLQGLSSCKISKELNYNSTSILNYLKKEGINTCRKPKFYNDLYKIDYFEKIDTERKAYFLGLILADGCISGNSLILYLQEEDGYIIKELLKDLSLEESRLIFNQKVNERCKNQVSIHLSNTKLVEDLSKYGIVPRKSHITYFPNIPMEFYHHFIRGVFDGDGSISRPSVGPYYTFNICGTTALVNKIQEILIYNCNLGKTKLSIPKKNSPNINVLIYSGNRQCIRIKEYLYKDATIFLTRKKEKFDSIINTWKLKTKNRE